MRPQRHATQSSGFTLLEVLVALSVFGLLLAGLSQGLRTGLGLVEAQTRKLAAHGELDAVENTLRGLIARMKPGSFHDTKPPLVGTADRLAFTTTLPRDAGATAAREADVVLAVVQSHACLLWAPHYKRPIRPLPPGRVELLDGVDRLEFAYWNAEGGWRSDWSERLPPRLIRMRFVFTPASGRHAPDIVVGVVRDQLQ